MQWIQLAMIVGVQHTTRQHVDSKGYKCGASDYQLICIRNSNLIERHFSKSRQIPDCSMSPFTSSKMARKVDLVHNKRLEKYNCFTPGRFH